MATMMQARASAMKAMKKPAVKKYCACGNVAKHVGQKCPKCYKQDQLNLIACFKEVCDKATARSSQEMDTVADAAPVPRLAPEATHSMMPPTEAHK